MEYTVLRRIRIERLSQDENKKPVINVVYQIDLSGDYSASENIQLGRADECLQLIRTETEGLKYPVGSKLIISLKDENVRPQNSN